MEQDGCSGDDTIASTRQSGARQSRMLADTDSLKSAKALSVTYQNSPSKRGLSVLCGIDSARRKGESRTVTVIVDCLP